MCGGVCVWGKRCGASVVARGGVAGGAVFCGEGVVRGVWCGVYDGV